MLLDSPKCRPWVRAIRCALLLLLAAIALHATVIHGVVLEQSSGKPLSRAQVTLTPLPGIGGQAVSVRSNSFGSFNFGSVPGGAYIASATRRGYPAVQYGQKNWRAAGTPLIVEGGQPIFLNIRMPRYGAITGLVVDENDVGIPDHEVVAYLNTRPPRLAGHAQADDRGIFRIPSLMPGRYLVRTTPRLYEDAGYLPTFSKESQRVDDASFLEVDLDRDAGEARVRPIPGRLHSISGKVFCVLPYPPPPSATVPATVTLVSDTGRDTMTTFCPGGTFRFPDRAPGPHEIWANTGDGQGAYVAFDLENHDWQKDVALLLQVAVTVSYRGSQGQRIDPGSVDLEVRRVDLAGESPQEKQKVTNGRISLTQGHWQFRMMPNATYVATDFRGCRTGERPEGGRADLWNDTVLNQRTCFINYTLSNHPAAVRGTVTTGHDPVGGAPVFLEPWDPVNRRRLGDPRSVRTDMQGRYELIGLAPGTYRLVSTFEYLNPEAGDVDEMRPRMVVVEEGRDQQQDIDLFVIR
jgi:hypothetical protein